MKTLTITKDGEIIPYITTVNGKILVGEEGRNRVLKEIEVPKNGVMKITRPSKTEVCLFGSFKIAGEGEYVGNSSFPKGDPRIEEAMKQGANFAQVRERHIKEEGQLTEIPSNMPESTLLILVRDQSGFRGSWKMEENSNIKKIAVGRRAQGDAGRMGDGPEYLLSVPSGESIVAQRTGRLYGCPEKWTITNEGGSLVRQREIEKLEDLLGAVSPERKAFDEMLGSIKPQNEPVQEAERE